MVDEKKSPSPITPRKYLSHRGRQMCLQFIVGIVILFSGIVTGWGATVLWLKDKVVLGPAPAPRYIVEDMRTRYDLTPQQAKQVEDVLGKSHKAVAGLRQDFEQKITAELQKLSAEMKKILSPEQLKRWEHDCRARRERGPGPMRRGPGRRAPGQPGPDRRGPGPRGPGGPGPRRLGLREPNSTSE